MTAWDYDTQFQKLWLWQSSINSRYPAADLIQFRCLTRESFYSQITAPKANFSLQNDSPLL